MTDERMGEGLWAGLAALPRGGGIVFRHHATSHAGRRRLFTRIARIARRRGLVLIRAGDRWLGPGEDGVHAARGIGLRTAPAHTIREALAARRRGADLVFVSPVHPTRSHPGVRPLGPLRAAAIARAARLSAIALGGMDEATFRRLRGLGFSGWAGIDAWTAPARQKRKAVPI